MHWGFATIVHSCPIQFLRDGPSGFFKLISYPQHIPGLRKLLQCKAQLLLVLVPGVQTCAAAELAGQALWNPLCPELHCTLQLVAASEQQEKHVRVCSSITSTSNTSTVNPGEALTWVFFNISSAWLLSCTPLSSTLGALQADCDALLLGKAMALAAGGTQRRSLKINREQAA